MKTATVLAILVILSVLASAKANAETENGYWKPDSVYKPETNIEIDITPYVNAWCDSRYGRVWGCAMRIWKSFDYDGTERPAKCVIIVDRNLSEADRARVIAHEKCHCAGYDHPDNNHHGKFPSCPIPV